MPLPSVLAGPQEVGPQEMLVLLYGGADEEHLLLSDYIKPHPTVVRVAASSDVTGSDISLEEALQNEKIDILLIPGGTLPESMATLVDALKKLVKVADHTIAIDSGVTLLARTELLSGHILAAEAAKIQGLRDEFPEIRWEDVSLYRNGQYWSAVGAPGVFRPLGNIFSLALKNHVGYWYPFLPSMPRKRPLSLDVAEAGESNKKRLSAGETTAKEILAHTKVDHVFLTAGDFAGRLACESFLDAGNSILLALLDTFPNSDNKIGLYVRRSFEFLWERAGPRPPVPWEQPSAEELAEWAESMRGNWPADDERESTFETLCDMVALGDLDPRPYGLTTTLALAVELGKRDKVQELGDLLARRQRIEEHPATWIQISKYRTLAGLILDGTFKRSSDQTADSAQQDADTVIAAIRAWPNRNSAYRAARSQRQAALSTQPFDFLITQLEPSKWEGEEALRREPASEDAIRAAQDRLGVALPEDYKAFLRVSNGLGLLPPLGLPGLRTVESLEWEESEGLKWLEGDLGLELDPAEREKVPKIGRVLMISDEADEENVWLYEPAQVKEVLEVIKTERKQTEYAQEVGWRVGFWLHWSPEYITWYKSVREYLESAVLKANGPTQ